MVNHEDAARRRTARLTQHLTAAESADLGDDINVLQGSAFATGTSDNEPSLKDQVSPEEWALRCDLAAAYRYVAINKWDDAINNHLTVRIPGTNHFLINCFGDGFDEITASSLVKIDVEGNVIMPGVRGDAVNRAGFVIHSCMHEGRADAHAVAHTHDPSTVAVSCDKRGLLPITQTALLCGEISYHDFEGVALNDEEKVRLKADFKEESTLMILRNHGSLAIGETIAQCMTRLYFLIKACEYQTQITGEHNNINPVANDVQTLTKTMTFARPLPGDMIDPICNAHFALFKRQVQRQLPGFDR
ncbi:Putative aldolase class 2 protein CC_1201 [Durusdinium trenchii]|uniref:Aldolase class 2 protein CC_1201 n=1 Tax=Durusdinium trenchii TaxID=1381693 RepID=A0ABP0PU76_9DINO